MTVVVSSTPAPDGGWGWVVMIATSINNFLLAALWKGTGVMYVALTQELPISLTQAALIISLCSGISCMLGPLASALSARYTHRVMVFCGALLAAIGFGLNVFFTSLEGFIICFSILSGTGIGLMLVPNIVIVHQYFHRRRSFASGFSMAGGAIGGFAMPPLLDWVSSTYGLTETLLTLSALFLHICPLALLLRPVDMSRKKPKKSKSQDIQGKNQDILNEKVAKLKVDDQVVSIPNSNDCEQDSLLKVKLEKDSTQTSEKSTSLFQRALQRFLTVSTVDPTIFKEKYFYLVTFSSLVFVFSFVGFMTIFPAFVTSESSEPVSLMNAVLLLSIMSIGDLVFRIAGGWLMDLKWINRRYAFMLFQFGLLTLTTGYLFPQNYKQHVVSSVFLGIFIGGLVILPPVVLNDQLGPKRFPMAYSIHASVCGCIMFIAAPSLAYLREVYGSYRPCVFLMVACYSAALFFWTVDVVYLQWKRHRTTTPTPPQNINIESR